MRNDLRGCPRALKTGSTAKKKREHTGTHRRIKRVDRRKYIVSTRREKGACPCTVTLSTDDDKVSFVSVSRQHSMVTFLSVPRTERERERETGSYT